MVINSILILLLGHCWRTGENLWYVRWTCYESELTFLEVYDLLANRRTVKISAHLDDVNSCCWADQGSNVLISASDDTFIKVW